MSEQMPPPGAERDAEIARLLGWEVEPPDSSFAGGVKIPGATIYHYPSTDSYSCDVFVVELTRLGWQVQFIADADSCAAFLLDAERASGPQPVALSESDRKRVGIGRNRPDAISAAALLALRPR